MIAARQIAFGGSKRKPYDAEIEYLESTGTQYMLFDEVINGFEGKLLPGGSNVYGAVGNWNGGSQRNCIFWTTVQDRGWSIASQGVAPIYSGDMRKEMLFVTVRGIDATIGGVAYTLNKGWSNKPQFMLFGNVSWGSSVSEVGAVSTQACQIGSCKLYCDDVLVRDLIPVRVGDVGYMYDKVSGQLFGNAGTGAFILGADAVSVNGGGITADV